VSINVLQESRAAFHNHPISRTIQHALDESKIYRGHLDDAAQTYPRMSGVRRARDGGERQTWLTKAGDRREMVTTASAKPAFEKGVAKGTETISLASKNWIARFATWRK
jgi:hypothetical protein